MEHDQTINNLLLALLALVGTFGSAYYGAKFAYTFQRTKEDRKELNLLIEGINLTIFNLMRMHHFLNSFKTTFIDPHREEEDNHFTILPSTSNISHLDIDFSRLTFLLKTDQKNLLNDLSLMQLQVNATVDTTNRRSAFHMDILQPRIEEAHEALMQVKKLSELEAVIGPRLTESIKQLTKHCIEGVDDSLKQLSSGMMRLEAAAKAQFPEEPIIGARFMGQKPN